MFGRMSLGSLFVLALLAPGVCWGQAGYGYGPANGPTGPMMPPYAGQYVPQSVGAPIMNGGHNRTIYEELPDDRGWLFEDSPLSKSLENSFRHAYFRTEYLLWSLGDPGKVLLGEPLASGLDPRDPNNVPVTDQGGTNVGLGVVPTLDDFQLSGKNGFRGTFGVPFGQGTFEANAFVFQTSSIRLDLTDVIGTIVDPTDPFSLPAFVAQPVLVLGAPSNSNIVYDDSYQAVLKTSVWGTEANYIFAAPNAGAGDMITISPLVGFRYFNFRESLNQTGDYEFTNDGGVTFSTVTRRIDSSTINNSYGPQIGLRTELTISRLTVGAEPKVMVGLNSYKASLFTQNILNPDDLIEPDVNIHDKETKFGPLADLKVYSRIAVSQNLQVFTSYNLVWAGMLTRPYDNIVYNSVAGVGDFQQDVQTTNTILQGLSVGAEFRY